MIGLLRRCFAFTVSVARQAGRRGLLAAVLVLAGAALEGVGIVLLLPLLATLFGVGGEGGRVGTWLAEALPQMTPAGQLSVLMALFAGLMAVRALVLWQRDVHLAAVQVGYVEQMRVNIARRLAAARWETLSRLGHARIHHLMGGELQRCGAGVHFLLQSGTALIMLAVQLGIAFLLAPGLTAVALALLAGGALALGRVLRRSHEAGQRMSAANQTILDEVSRFLSGMKVAMSQNLEASFLSAFARNLGTAVDQQLAFMRQQSLMRGTWSLLGALVAIVVVLAGFAWLQMPGPVLLTLLVVLSRVSGPASLIQLGLQQIAFSLPAFEAVQSLCAELPAAQRARPPALPDGAPLWPVRFEGVTYHHPGGAGVRDVHLTLEPGEIVALSGVSGAGKTTLADLLCGLLEPQGGRILAGDAPLVGERAALWREGLAYVAQDAVMFNDTVRANLAWGHKAVAEADMAAALRLAGADGLVARLPRGLDTMLGERGALVSGGERQRLALARALLRDPALLVLDEATSALDPEAERAIMARLRALAPRPAMLVIAHRAETLAMCDRIIRVERGTVPVSPGIGVGLPT